MPVTLLASIQQQEDALAAEVANGTDKNGQAAAQGYADLHAQVVALEKLTPDQIRQRATLDLQSLALALHQVQSQNISVATFQTNFQQGQQQLGAATTAKDLFAADGYIMDQADAVSQIIPVYNEMQALNALVNTETKAMGSPAATSLECAQANAYSPSFYTSDAQMLAAAGLNPKNAVMIGGNTKYTFSSWPSQNQTTFQSAKTSADFAELSVTLLSEMSQLNADAEALLPAQTAAAVAAFQADVQTYTKDGGKTATYTQEATQDQQALDATATLADIATLAKTVAKHRQDFALPFIKVKAQADMQTLTNLVLQANQTTIYDSYDGASYPIAYEYIGFQYSGGRDWAGDPQDEVDTKYGMGGQGIGDARLRLANAQSIQDYTAVENEIQMFTQNIPALISDYAQMPKDDKARAAWSMTAHQTRPRPDQLLRPAEHAGDRRLVRRAEGAAVRKWAVGDVHRHWELRWRHAHPGPKGFVDAFDVTTGSPDLPSLPGMHCVLPSKIHDYDDVAPDSLKGTQFWYAPTHIHFGFPYADPGYLMHDAWWRDVTGMGYLTNLPHYDPLAFNGGSHGCINFHYSNGDMATVWAFAQEGMPIIVY